MWTIVSVAVLAVYLAQMAAAPTQHQGIVEERINPLKPRRTADVVGVEQELYVGLVDPPVVNITCRQNCGVKKRFTSDIVLNGQCISKCVTEFGPVSYQWVLFELVEDNYIEISGDALEQLTHSGTTGTSLFLKAFQLNGGSWYRAVLMASTPYSANTTVVQDFVVNKPPAGGFCKVTPTSGVASKTLFNVSCPDWKEGKPRDPNSKLKYEFRIGAKGSSRKMLFYYGDSPPSTPCLFPVGSLDAGFQADMVLYIVDSVGDYSLQQENVTVYPPAVTKADLAGMASDLAVGANSSLAVAIANEDFQTAMGVIYSMVSILNIPLDWTPTDANTSIQMSDLELKAYKIAVREARETFMAYINAIPIATAGALELSNEVMHAVLFKVDEDSKDALTQAQLNIASMTQAYLTMKNGLTPERSLSIAKDITSSGIRVMLDVDGIIAKSFPDYELILNNTDADGGPQENASIIPALRDREWGGNLVLDIMNMLNTISQSFFATMGRNDVSVDLAFDELSLLLGKELTTNVAHNTYTPLQSAAETDHCLQRQG